MQKDTRVADSFDPAVEVAQQFRRRQALGIGGAQGGEVERLVRHGSFCLVEVQSAVARGGDATAEPS